ncbi:MAG: hypothetical protein RM368_10380 [Nostoc sp. DedSLP03]|uniref:hypothetical protein n=1 Tax=Nostoc sp. DedSLP03 TaxID=3075400 RepID=UPI002AD3E8BE|nr:hypothetical protein [Nostoc sp. DedSLP03]MDZ7965367.1 hypothetical protein [Nostoc sp. DedSLP03]
MINQHLQAAIAELQEFTEFSGSPINISHVYEELRLRKHAEALLKQTNEELEVRVEERNIELIQANHDQKLPLRNSNILRLNWCKLKKCRV